MPALRSTPQARSRSEMATLSEPQRTKGSPNSWPWWWISLVAVVSLPLIVLFAVGQFLPWAEPTQQGCNRRTDDGQVWQAMAFGQDISDTEDRQTPTPTPTSSPTAGASTKPGPPSVDDIVIKRREKDRIELTPLDGPGAIVIAFGMNRGGVPRRVEFETSEPLRRIDQLGGLYADDALGTPAGRVPDQNIRYRVEMVRGIMTIRFCVSPLGIAPGTYAGGVHLRDVRFEEKDIPLRISLQYNGWHLVIAALWVSLIAGAVFKWAGALRAIESPLTWTWAARDLFVWAGARSLALSGAVVAMVGIFTTQYLADTSWASTPQSWAAVLAAGFAATVTAVSAGEVAKPTREKKLEGNLGPVKEPSSAAEDRDL